MSGTRRDRGIAVTSSPGHSILCGQPIKPLGPNTWITVLNPDDPDPRPLQVTYLLARYAAIAALAGRDDLDASVAINDAIE